jgi:hypothetical protein
MKKGQTNNPNGRPKGSRNRTTKQMKAALMAALGPELDQLPELLAGMEPDQRVNALSKLIGYILPKATESESGGGNAMSIAEAIRILRGEAGRDD